jgi:hypothetical protein
MDSSTDSNNSVNRFGAKSRNMFFVRHTAAPKHLKTIVGIDGVQVCSMKENEYKLPNELKQKIFFQNNNNFKAQSREDYITDSKYKIAFNNDHNQKLLNNYVNYLRPKNLKERIFPPIKHWTATYHLGNLINEIIYFRSDYI